MGAANAGEADAAARREAIEEIGVLVADVVEIGEWRPAPGLTPQRTTIFVAPIIDEELDRSVATWSPSEEIEEVAAVRQAALAEMVADGRTTDGFSLAGFLILRLWLEQQESRS